MLTLLDAAGTSFCKIAQGAKESLHTDQPNIPRNTITTFGQVGNGDNQLFGTVATFIIYGRALSDPEIAQVEAYLATRYNI